MSTSTSSIADALPSGTQLQGDHFAISQVLGQGGFGITYHGGDMRLRRYVAIKEFFPQGCTRHNNEIQHSSAISAIEYESAKRKFLQEARALARFNHRNIVQAITIFEESNSAYMVMEFLKGKTLQEVIEDRKVLPESEAIALIEQVGAALTALHEANLIHRDVKPANIMICDDGRTVLIDFGLNKEMEQVGSMGTRRFTATAQFGTEGYAPPEQYVKNAQAGSFTDVYALGATLYHLLTGEVPVSAPQRSMGHDLMPPERVNPNVSRAVSDVVMNAMEIKSLLRPQSVQAFLTSLHSKPVQVLQPPQSASQSPPLHPVPQASTGRGTTYTGNAADDSGMGAASILPAELQGYNWGALFVGALWASVHKAWIGLLGFLCFFIPNILVSQLAWIGFFAWLGTRGNELAWQNRKWQSVSQFKDVQKKWANIGGVIFACVNLSFIAFVLPNHVGFLGGAKYFLKSGNAYADRKEHDLAIAEFSKAIEKDPNSASAYFNRGNSYDSLQAYDAAIADYTKAISIKPDHAKAYINRGNTYLHEGENQLAVADYNKALSIDPNDSIARRNLQNASNGGSGGGSVSVTVHVGQ